ncbi:N-acetylmuramoyl-L-alanine amidase [Paenibacillus sp. IB182496]|uniref:N-acetylmuramoyl-L-alanine amidase n=1 Tax=Paenibacillus sabuli TaxID=2772509 RepID=A0A927BSG5_9BACL|nr:N-acetylmuramoyl-L-alanine amidase [Paenibacillus sabuli]MBD2845091.1 N-acetylmuramoyl-L-alanine amidase [Paenibacillus sabuli]
MKKLVSFMLALTMVLVLFNGEGQAAEKQVVPKLYLNGQELQTSVSPMLKSNVTMVPLSVITSSLGHYATWNKDTRTVTVHNNGLEMLLKINSTIATVNDKAVEMRVAAFIEDGRTMVPLRFIGESLGLDFYWDNSAKAAHMTKKVEPPVETESPNEDDPGAEQPEANPGGGQTGGGVFPEGLPDPTPEQLRPVPTDAIGAITGIRYELSEDEGTRILIDYEGKMNSAEAFAIDGPDRLVLDLPYAAFASDFVEGFQLDPQGKRSAEGKLVAEGQAALTAVRYSAFSDKPSTVRVVLDLTGPAEFATSQADGQLRIDVKPDASRMPLYDASGNRIYKVVIDAGHGDHDPGAASVTKRAEKEFNLSVALKVNALLEKEPRIQPYMTRDDDTFVDLYDRAEFANDRNADIFVSIHGNSYYSHISGTETYYTHDRSRSLANVMHKHLVDATGLPDRGVRTARFVVIRETDMPSVLLESGYLSNVTDEKVLFSEEGQNKIAKGIVAGIKEYFNLK